MAHLPAIRSKNEQVNPFHSITRLQRQVDRMFDDFLNDSWALEIPTVTSNITEDVFQPLCDVQETASHYLLSFDLPGMAKNDLKIDLQDHVLRVHGERKDEREKGKGSNVRTERFYGVIDRALTLPENTKSEGIEAQFENGVLNIAIPKAEITQPKQIQIGESKPGLFSKLLGKKDEKAA